MLIDEIAYMFTSLTWLTIILLVAGIIFFVIELFFLPGFGACGILGILCLFASSISHAIITSSIVQFIIMFFFTLIIVIILIIIFVQSAKRGLINKSPLILTETAIPNEYYEKADKEKQELIGKVGISNSKINPAGIMLYNGKEYEVFTRTTYIDKGIDIKVIGIDSGNLIVEQHLMKKNDIKGEE